MIKIENTSVHGFEAAMRGMRNPMNSWHKSDSGRCQDVHCEDCTQGSPDKDCVDFVIGKNDLNLALRLLRAGTDHSKFMRMISAACDIVAPRYWWAEADTYRIGVEGNSCSTMHKIHEKDFTLADFSAEHLDDESLDSLSVVISRLNKAREDYIRYSDKSDWWQMIQLLPASYNQRRTKQFSYQALRNIYHARKNHKLDEWRDFCRWVESLPYSELITDSRNENRID